MSYGNREKAKLSTTPNHSNLLDIAGIYDTQFMNVAERIHEAVFMSRRGSHNGRGFKNDASRLRPHYKIFYEAYLNQFFPPEPGSKEDIPANAKFADEKVIAFFENCVHDSLSGFGVDETLPSDPRVNYVSRDAKLRYEAIAR